MAHQVDVLMPTYKPDRNHLRTVLASLQGQSYTDWACLIHDEPTDVDTASFVEDFLSDPRIRYEKSQQRLGIGKNWNATFKKTSAPLVAYLFQDDYWAPEYLEKAVKILNEHSHVGMASMSHEYKLEGEDDTHESYDNVLKLKEEKLIPGAHKGKKYLASWLEDGLWPNLIGEPCFVVMRRSVMEKAGLFDEQMQQQLDIAYWVKMLLAGDLYYEQSNCGFFRVHSEAASARNRRDGKGFFDRLHILNDLIKTLPAGELQSHAKQAKAKQVIRIFKLMTHFALRHPVETVKMIIRRN